MNSKQDLDRIDRATLRMWRASNLLGWGFLALIAGRVVEFVAANAASATANLFGGTLVPHAASDLAYALMVGAAVGALVGLHVYRSPGLVAGMAALLGVALWPFLGWFTFGNLLLAIAITGGAEMLGAILVARAVWVRRVSALRAPD